MLRAKLSRRHRWFLPPVAFALALLPLMNAAAAVHFDILEVTQQAGSYRIHGEVYLDAAPPQVYAELIDFQHLSQINLSVQVSKVLKAIDAHSQLVYTETRGCVLIFCHTIRQVQRFTEFGPDDILAMTVPGSGNVKRGTTAWHLQADDGGTLLSWTAVCEPDFWVPPFIGTQAIATQLRNQALESIQALERLAQEQADTIPNARMTI